MPHRDPEDRRRWRREYEARNRAQIAARQRAKRAADYAGSCGICGAPTDGSGGPGKAQTYCKHHAPAVYGVLRRGSGPMQNRALGLLAEPVRMRDLAEALAITTNHAWVLLDRLLRHGLVRRVRRGWYVRA